MLRIGNGFVILLCLLAGCKNYHIAAVLHRGNRVRGFPQECTVLCASSVQKAFGQLLSIGQVARFRPCDGWRGGFFHGYHYRLFRIGNGFVILFCRLAGCENYRIAAVLHRRHCIRGFPLEGTVRFTSSGQTAFGQLLSIGQAVRLGPCDGWCSGFVDEKGWLHRCLSGKIAIVCGSDRYRSGTHIDVIFGGNSVIPVFCQGGSVAELYLHCRCLRLAVIGIGSGNGNDRICQRGFLSGEDCGIAGWRGAAVCCFLDSRIEAVPGVPGQPRKDRAVLPAVSIPTVLCSCDFFQGNSGVGCFRRCGSVRCRNRNRLCDTSPNDDWPFRQYIVVFVRPLQGNACGGDDGRSRHIGAVVRIAFRRGAHNIVFLNALQLNPHALRGNGGAVILLGVGHIGDGRVQFLRLNGEDRSVLILIIAISCNDHRNLSGVGKVIGRLPIAGEADGVVDVSLQVFPVQSNLCHHLILMGLLIVDSLLLFQTDICIVQTGGVDDKVSSACIRRLAVRTAAIPNLKLVFTRIQIGNIQLIGVLSQLGRIRSHCHQRCILIRPGDREIHAVHHSGGGAAGQEVPHLRGEFFLHLHRKRNGLAVGRCVFVLCEGNAGNFPWCSRGGLFKFEIAVRCAIAINTARLIGHIFVGRDLAAAVPDGNGMAFSGHVEVQLIVVLVVAGDIVGHAVHRNIGDILDIRDDAQVHLLAVIFGRVINGACLHTAAGDVDSGAIGRVSLVGTTAADRISGTIFIIAAAAVCCNIAAGDGDVAAIIIISAADARGCLSSLCQNGAAGDADITAVPSPSSADPGSRAASICSDNSAGDGDVAATAAHAAADARAVFLEVFYSDDSSGDGDVTARLILAAADPCTPVACFSYF